MADDGWDAFAVGGDGPPPYNGPASPQATPPGEPIELEQPSSRNRVVLAVVLAVLLLPLGIGIGYLMRGPAVNEQTQRADAAELEAAKVSAQRDRLQQKVDSRAAQQAADEAAAKKAEQTRLAAEQKKAADDAAAAKKAADDAAAAQAEADRQAAEAAAEAQRQADAEAARQAAEAEKRRVIHSGDGIFLVGTDIDAGRWRTSGDGTSCYYAILNGLGGGLDDIDSNNNVTGPAIVDLQNGKYLELSHCAEWRHE